MNGPSMQVLLFVALPYTAIGLFVVGLVWRHRHPLDISARSSQVLESRWLSIGTIPFHIGLAVLIVGHLLPLLFPAAWLELVSNRRALLAIEGTGAAAAMLTAGGLAILLVRRLALERVRARSKPADLIVLAILLAQVVIGFLVAVMHRWGAVWSVATVMPYLRSVLVLSPDMTLAAGMPGLVTIHLTAAWVILALIPYTRLVHVFSVPLGYLVRRPQKVVWSTRRA